jgi:hypothetical protein
MSNIEIHNRDCKKKLGKSWQIVHEWLDEFASSMGVPAHRRMRHHIEGIDTVRSEWGDEAAQAAEIHIKRDLFFWGGEIPHKDEYDDVNKSYYKAKKDMFG